MAEQRNSPSLYVDARDVGDEVVRDAKVAFTPDGRKTKPIPIPFDPSTCLYAAAVPPGSGELSVKHGKLEAQTRDIAAPARELVILGARGAKTFFRGNVRVPITAEPGLIGVTLIRAARRGAEAGARLAAELKIEPLRTTEIAERAGMRLFKVPARSVPRVLERLSRHPLVEQAGAVVTRHESAFSHLTRDIVVAFRGPRGDQVRAIAAECGYRVERALAYAPSTYVLRWEKPASLAILDSIERLAARPDVAWAEPSLVVTPDVDAVIPNDYLWPGLWDRQLIGVQDAWQALQDAGKPPFGDPNIVLAIWDSGVQSAGGVPTNQDFVGTVSNGQPKLLATFDFDTMVANNDNPWLDHGSGVAGVAAAMANNPSPVPGIGYGVTGAAPNVQVMTLIGRTPYVDIEVADQYVWMAGFDPHSPLPGFPAAPPPRGADVITCSLTPGQGAPLSGTARAALDFVTTFGRAGKGTLCFFSTGNQDKNNLTWRPYSAYEKCFGIAATSLADNGATEIRAPYSGWNVISFCAPSQDALLTTHNPPAGFMPWSGEHKDVGNLVSFPQTQTVLTGQAAVGATVLKLASVAGFAVNAIIHVGAIGAPGSEPARVTMVDAMNNKLTVEGFKEYAFGGGLLNLHQIGDPVATGPADHINYFGGTSSATPLSAGAAALVLSANPDLTYIEAREILRDTAVKFDLNNNHAVGRWLDINGNPSLMSGLPPVKSGWYGYGRIDAEAAVQEALGFALSRDLVIRDNLADTGAVTSAGAFWNSPDIWCRRLAPAMDPGALPAGYATAGPHEKPVRAHDNWVYARVRNRGTSPSLDAWVRLSVSHFPGMEFTWPASFQPTEGPGDPIPQPMTPGTYFIGEAKVSGLAPGEDRIVSVKWPASLIPPAEVDAGMGPVHWHPCLLAEISPHDGPAPTGSHVWDDNNLAQKNITIVDTDADADSGFRFANVIGHQDNLADTLILEIDRGRLPAEVRLYVDLLDPALLRQVREPALAGAVDFAGPQPWEVGRHKGEDVLFLRPEPRVQIPLPIGRGRIVPLAIGGIIGKGAAPGDYEIVMLQRQPTGEISGSATLQLGIGRKKGK